MENKENIAFVKEWRDKGYEIGNHSYNHLFNFGSLNKFNLKDEIFKSHEKIFQIIGEEPKGFIAPTWGFSKELIDVLIELKYEYDSSSFPSFLLYPMITKIVYNHKTNFKKGLKILNRSDWFDPFSKPTNPYLVNSYGEINKIRETQNIVELPLPTLSRFKPSIWHTLLFIFGKEYFIQQLKSLLSSHKGFYYVMHPADFLGIEDLDKKMSLNLERTKINLDFKLSLIEEIFTIFANSGRKMVTMRELAAHNKNLIINKN